MLTLLLIASYVFLGLCVTCLVHSWVLFHLFIPKLWYLFLPFCPHPYPFFFQLHAFFHSTHCPLPWPCPIGCCPTTYCLYSALYSPIKEPLAYPLWQITSPFWVKVNLLCSHLTSLSKMVKVSINSICSHPLPCIRWFSPTLFPFGKDALPANICPKVVSARCQI